MKTTLRLGGAQIAAALAQLPATQHPLTEAEKFVVDGWTQPAVLENDVPALFVTVHGQFSEGTLSFVNEGYVLIKFATEPRHGLRSFDRAFILAPAPAQSR